MRTRTRSRQTRTTKAGRTHPLRLAEDQAEGDPTRRRHLPSLRQPSHSTDRPLTRRWIPRRQRRPLCAVVPELSWPPRRAQSPTSACAIVHLSSAQNSDQRFAHDFSDWADRLPTRRTARANPATTPTLKPSRIGTAAGASQEPDPYVGNLNYPYTAEQVAAEVLTALGGAGLELVELRQFFARVTSFVWLGNTLADCA
jgi:hypothetical protein